MDRLEAIECILKDKSKKFFATYGIDTEIMEFQEYPPAIIIRVENQNFGVVHCIDDETDWQPYTKPPKKLKEMTLEEAVKMQIDEKIGWLTYDCYSQFMIKSVVNGVVYNISYPSKHMNVNYTLPFEVMIGKFTIEGVYEDD